MAAKRYGKTYSIRSVRISCHPGKRILDALKNSTKSKILRQTGARNPYRFQAKPQEVSGKTRTGFRQNLKRFRVKPLGLSGKTNAGAWIKQMKQMKLMKPVITKYNDSELSVTNLLNYLTSIEMVKDIHIAPGSFSLCKPYIFSSTVEKIEKIRKIAELFKAKTNIKISVQGINTPTSIEERFKRRETAGLCSGNVHSFYVLPDGKVTICEQMYWHPFFILGDLSKQSIMEVWNSEKALALWNISQDEIQDSSPCKTCKEFEECRRGKGTCWRFAISAYGTENYDYPSPDCPYAPEVTRPFYMPEK